MRIGRLLLALSCLGMPVQGLWGQAPVSTRVGPPAENKPNFRIGIIADAQFCDRDASGGRFYRISLEKLHAAVDSFNAQKVDMVINLGDLIDERIESFPTVLREIDRLEMPIHHLLGNHEFWDVPFHMQSSVLDSLGMQSGYCDLELPGWRFLMLDGTDLAEYSQGAHRELEAEARLCRSSLEGQANDDIWNGAIGETQLAWLEWQLADAANRDQKVALFCHFPISPAGHPMTLWNEADLRVLLSRFPNAKAWFAGHSHTGGYSFLERIHHLTFEGMLMTPDSNAFAILDFFDDRILVEGYGREPYRVLGLTDQTRASLTLLPDTSGSKAAIHGPDYPCTHRQFIDAFGRIVLIDDAGGNEAPRQPRLKPGCYEIREASSETTQSSRLIILPSKGK